MGASWSLPRITIMSSSVSGRLLPFLPAPPDGGLAAAGRGGAGGALLRSASMSSSVNGSSGSLVGGVPLEGGCSGGCRKDQCRAGGDARVTTRSEGGGGALRWRKCTRACRARARVGGRPDHAVLPWRGRREAPAPAGLGAPPAAGGGVALGSAQHPVSYAARSDAVLGSARAAAAPAAFLGGACLGGASGTCARSAVKRSTQVGRWCSDLQARQWPCRGVSFTIS